MAAQRPVLLALSASPRPRGASTRLLAAFCRGAVQAGWRVTRLALSSLHIQPCRGCNRCLDSQRKCSQADDMPHVLRHLDHAEALLFSSPVYFYGFPSPAKAVIDRCHPLWHDPRWRRRKRRPAFFLSTCDASSRREFEVIIRQARAFFNTAGFDYCGEWLVPGMKTRLSSSRWAGLEKRAETLGRRWLAGVSRTIL